MTDKIETCRPWHMLERGALPMVGDVFLHDFVSGLAEGRLPGAGGDVV